MEVTASELMIGNLLYFKGTDMVATVQLINAPKHFDCRDEFGSFVPNGEYDPIPITEDWLIKLGFEKTYESAYRIKFDLSRDYRFGYDIPKSLKNMQTGLSFRGDTYSNINQVHLVQNFVFALTQQPLTIKK